MLHLFTFLLALLLFSRFLSGVFIAEVSLEKLAGSRHTSAEGTRDLVVSIGCSCSPFTCCISKTASLFTAYALW